MLEAEHYLIFCVSKPNELMEYYSNRFCSISWQPVVFSQFNIHSCATGTVGHTGISQFLAFQRSCSVVSLTAAGFIRVIRAVSGPITPPVRGDAAPVPAAELPPLTSCAKTPNTQLSTTGTKTHWHTHQEPWFIHSFAAWRLNDNTKITEKILQKYLNIYKSPIYLVKQTNKKKRKEPSSTITEISNETARKFQ